MRQYNNINRVMGYAIDHFKNMADVICRIIMIAIVAMLFAGNVYAKVKPDSVKVKEKAFTAQGNIYKYYLSLNLVFGKIGKMNEVEDNALIGSLEGDINGIPINGFVKTIGDNLSEEQIVEFINVVRDLSVTLHVTKKNTFFRNNIKNK